MNLARDQFIGAAATCARTKLNSLIGIQSYQRVRRILCEATKKLSILDTLPN